MACRSCVRSKSWSAGGDDAPQTHGDLEATIRRETGELARQLLQARLDVLFEPERANLAAMPPWVGREVRARERQLESEFGRVLVSRHELKTSGKKPAWFPIDEKLNLPRDLYSHSLRERVVDGARRGAWAQEVEQVDSRTGGHVPKPSS